MYCRCVDTKQWDTLRTLFVSDARFEGMGSAPTGATLDVWIKGISTRFRDVISVHHCHTPEIVFTSSGLARGVWAMSDYVEWPEGAGPHEAPEYRGFLGYGYYEEEYRNTDEGWKIVLVRLTRLRIDPLAPNRPPNSSQNLLRSNPNWLPVNGRTE